MVSFNNIRYFGKLNRLFSAQQKEAYIDVDRLGNACLAAQVAKKASDQGKRNVRGLIERSGIVDVPMTVPACRSL